MPEAADRGRGDASLGQRRENERKEGIRGIRFHPHGQSGEHWIHRQERCRENAAAEASRSPPHEPCSKRHQGEGGREREELNRQLRARRERAQKRQKKEEPGRMGRPERQHVGERGVPSQQRDPGVVQKERGRSEPRKAQAEGEEEDRGHRRPKGGAFLAIPARPGLSGRRVLPSPFGCQRVEYGTRVM